MIGERPIEVKTISKYLFLCITTTLYHENSELQSEFSLKLKQLLFFLYFDDCFDFDFTPFSFKIRRDGIGLSAYGSII